MWISFNQEQYLFKVWSIESYPISGYFLPNCEIVSNLRQIIVQKSESLYEVRVLYDTHFSCPYIGIKF